MIIQKKIRAINPQQLADVFNISSHAAAKCLNDGRFISLPLEYLLDGQQFGPWTYRKNQTHNNVRSYDGKLIASDKRDTKVRVVSQKVLTRNGVRFSESRYLGCGRSNTKENLLASLKRQDFTLIVDITQPPVYIVTLVANGILEDLVEEGKLDQFGWCVDDLYYNLKN
jgi:hypothetical protein